MVGDWPERDMVGAARLGMKTVFARYGDTKGVAESGADFEIDDIHDLLSIIERLNQPICGGMMFLLLGVGDAGVRPSDDRRSSGRRGPSLMERAGLGNLRARSAGASIG